MTLGEKKALNFPLWLEVIFIAALLIMSAVEFSHANWIWAVLFGLSGIAFAISLIARVLSGNKNAD